MKKVTIIILAAMLMMSALTSYSDSASSGLLWQEIQFLDNTFIHQIQHLNNKFIAVGSNASIATSVDGISWRKHIPEGINFPLPLFNHYDIHSVAYGNNIYVAIISSVLQMGRGGILTSLDGIVWRLETLIPQYTLRNIIYAPALHTFVITIRGSDSNSIMISPDGKNWEAIQIDGRSMRDIVYHDGLLVAVGGGNRIFTSRDARNWEKQETGIQDPEIALMDITYGNGIFVVAGWSQWGESPILISKDGKTWKQVDGWHQGRAEQIIYEGGRFFAMELGGHTRMSYCGEDWFPINHRFNTMTYHQGSLWGIETSRGISRLLQASLPLEEQILRLHINQKALTIEQGGLRQEVRLDIAPEIREGRTFLPIRPVIEAMGGSIAWSDRENRVDINLKNNHISLWINRSSARINGVDVPIDATNPKVAPYIAPPGRTMLPLRFIAETLGAEVLWAEYQKMVTIIRR